MYEKVEKRLADLMKEGEEIQQELKNMHEKANKFNKRLLEINGALRELTGLKEKKPDTVENSEHKVTFEG